MKDILDAIGLGGLFGMSEPFPPVPSPPDWQWDDSDRKLQSRMYNQSWRQHQEMAQRQQDDLNRLHAQAMRHQHHSLPTLLGEPPNPTLDPEWHTTHALTLLFGEHWKIINEELALLDKQRPT